MGGGGGGGLNCEAKAQVLVTPSPLFFLEVGCKKGGRNSGAVRCSQMDNVLLLNSGGSVVQLDTTDSGPRPHVSPLRIKSKRSKQIVKYGGFSSQIKSVLLLKLFSNIYGYQLKLESQYFFFL